jgi:hypothetical protein
MLNSKPNQVGLGERVWVLAEFLQLVSLEKVQRGPASPPYKKGHGHPRANLNAPP